ncbi:HAMP domain-containing histidine kinase [Paenibacillus sp. N1-5-1-14]|uniref:sensor histidine kinase n=1 Tax=Paenibacillus radicibacter TaxID=2972488 RepID=UPI002158ACE1|nr:HAMP domain-containing sensor histidine kinase [Paenibacillus radicibacter]MCR8645417.1 HAMP domain-containing histidine kinase [Paenibacillus radicibacter]
MKVKHWMLTAFVVVMILPLAAIYTLYMQLSQYDQKQDLLEYMSVSQRIANMEKVLQNISLYEFQSQKQYEPLTQLTSNTVKINLYRSDGLLLFTSLKDSLTPTFNRENKERLYSRMYDLQKNYSSYIVKKPVFDGSKMIGIYEITIAREQWIQGVEHRTAWLVSLLGLFFAILYGSVVTLLNRKLNRPIRQLMNQMTAFAHNQPVEPIRHRANDEVGQLINHFRVMREEIEAARLQVKTEQQEKEFIVAALSHDLKTPLTAISAYAELLTDQRRINDQEKREYSSLILDKITYMKHMLDDLTMYAVLRSSNHQMELIEADGEELFDMLLSGGYDELCAKKHIHLAEESSVTGVFRVNVAQLTRVVDNVMSNAIRYTQPGDRIWLGAFSNEYQMPEWIFPSLRNEMMNWHTDGVILIVQNQGKAIDKQDQSRVFEPFYQIDAARTKSKAGYAGLGLSIAKIVMDQHQGDIRLWSAPGYGTLVAVWLPEKTDTEKRG